MSLYAKDGDRLVDVTYGKGVFWRKVDMSRFNFSPSDLLTCKNKYDFRALPYADASVDITVFDPPYCHNPGALIVNANYKNAETTKGMYHNDILGLYEAGMREAWRILKEGGTLWVKCKDEVEASIQRWSHIEIYDIARRIGLYAKDLFVLTQKSLPVIQHAQQLHARKNHSYLWVLKKLGATEAKAMKRIPGQKRE